MSRECCGKVKDRIVIDLLYVDLSECERCQSSDKALDEAVRDLREQIHNNNITTIVINKTKITNDEQGKKYDVVRSPTLRIDGEDIEKIVNDQYEIKDSYCPSCEDVTGSECYEVTGGGNDCRVFEYKGEQYETIPLEMIKEAIIKVVGIEEKTLSNCCEPKNCC